MGGLAPGKLKSRRGWPSSPRRLIHGCYFFDPGFKNSLREKLYQLCGNGDTLIAIDSRRPGLFWSAKVALSFAATGTSMKSCMSFKAAGAFSDAAIWTVYRPVIVQGRSIRESSSPTAACSVRTNVCRSTYPEFQEQESHCGSDCGHRSDHRPRPIHFSDREPRQVFPKSVYRAVTQCGALTCS